MATRTIIEIDEELCNGCGLCAGGCPEGAIRIVDGKARLVGDSLCDGLGACVGDCPLGAITTVEREAVAYDEALVMEGISSKGANTIAAHLEHLAHHGQALWYGEAVDWLHAHELAVPPHDGLGHYARPKPAAAARPFQETHGHAGCPGHAARSFSAARPAAPKFAPLGAPSSAPARSPAGASGASGSALEQWPIQLHLINPRAPYFRGADLLVAASCTAFSSSAFHDGLLSGRKIVIGCPKLDSGLDEYEDKLVALMEESGINSVTVAIMEVPCCGGLSALVRKALERSKRKVPVETVVVSIEGGTLTRR
ncbi:MAG TPA: 4Fe-4S binding protein [Spirochaetales bacterium]|nr:4Fe-4S binding protein [Spirochaetales bacterium]